MPLLEVSVDRLTQLFRVRADGPGDQLATVARQAFLAAAGINVIRVFGCRMLHVDDASSISTDSVECLLMK